MQRTYIAGGNLGFSRLDCRKCRGNTLHRFGLCIHCGTEIARGAIPALNKQEIRIFKGIRLKGSL